MQTVGTATPIVCLTAPDGEVGRGAFLNAATCPRTAAELADLLTIAAEQLNPPPKFEGQQEVTKFVSDAGEDCPDGNCEPAVNETPAPVDGTLQPVVPRRPANALAIVIALGVLLSAGGIALGVSTGKIPLPDAFTDRL
jgi:hypothetical protein